MAPTAEISAILLADSAMIVVTRKTHLRTRERQTVGTVERHNPLERKYR